MMMLILVLLISNILVMTKQNTHCMSSLVIRELQSPEHLELERRRRRRRRNHRHHSQKPRKHRTLLVSAIDEQAKVIHVRIEAKCW